jgi:hypothetical protein
MSLDCNRYYANMIPPLSVDICVAQYEVLYYTPYCVLLVMIKVHQLGGKARRRRRRTVAIGQEHDPYTAQRSYDAPRMDRTYAVLVCAF